LSIHSRDSSSSGTAIQQCRYLPRCSVAASDDTWRIEIKCAFPSPTATRCCSCSNKYIAVSRNRYKIMHGYYHVVNFITDDCNLVIAGWWLIKQCGTTSSFRSCYVHVDCQNFNKHAPSAKKLS